MIDERRRPAQGKQLELVLLPEGFPGPAVLLRRQFDLLQHRANINRLAVVTAVIFAELFHAENFTQRRQDARKFLTRIARINTNPDF